ncbi:acyltransferase family protein [Pseudorhodoferax sp.]|uniref:acyltransferase family protein n=1 Tax=Pseudorhodoferax sp. TaxID=1993553 RepID=UPI002DD655D4|nr:acyltransferase [Pseudorhodoferax sp.]
MQYRANNFDFLRLAAAMMVLVSHQFALSGSHEPLTPLGSWGGTGVLIFFGISGFLVAGSWVQDPNPLRFAARRLLRIWPGLFVALLLVALVLGPLVSSLDARTYYSTPLTWKYFKQLGLWSFKPMLPEVFIGNPMPLSANGSLWTIPIEVRCYLVLALLGIVGLLRRAWWLPVAFLAFAIWFFFLFKVGYDQPIRMMLQMGVVFFCGASMYQLRSVWQAHSAMTWVCALAAIFALWHFGWQEIAATLGLPIVVVLIGTASTPVLRRAGRFGDLSYGLYIYAFPVQQTWVWLGGKNVSIVVGLLVCTSVTVVLAWLSWRLVERPALRLKPRAPDVGTKFQNKVGQAA